MEKAEEDNDIMNCFHLQEVRLWDLVLDTRSGSCYNGGDVIMVEVCYIGGRVMVEVVL